MAQQQDFKLTAGEDTTLVISIQPPFVLDGRSFVWTVAKKFGGSGLMVKSVGSGFWGMSGITFTSGTGIADVSIAGADTSGWDVPFNYAHKGEFTDLGADKRVVEGYMIIEG